MKKISILIPAFNEEHYIGKCLDSLIALNEPQLEIIVCDNGSTDRTREIVQSYAPHVTLVEEREKKGPNAARQKAFSVSTGEIIVTLDADCTVTHEWIKRGIRDFNKYDIVAISGICDFDGTRFFVHLLTLATRYALLFVHFITHRVAKRYGIMLGANAWYKREALIAIGGFDTNLEFYGDDATTARELTKIGIIKYDPKLRVMTSSRRFEKAGFFKTAYHYAINYLSIWVRRKQATKQTDIKHYR